MCRRVAQEEAKLGERLKEEAKLAEKAKEEAKLAEKPKEEAKPAEKPTEERESPLPSTSSHRPESTEKGASPLSSTSFHSSGRPAVGGWRMAQEEAKPVQKLQDEASQVCVQLNWATSCLEALSQQTMALQDAMHQVVSRVDQGLCQLEGVATDTCRRLAAVEDLRGLLEAQIADLGAQIEAEQRQRVEDIYMLRSALEELDAYNVQQLSLKLLELLGSGRGGGVDVQMLAPMCGLPSGRG